MDIPINQRFQHWSHEFSTCESHLVDAESFVSQSILNPTMRDALDVIPLDDGRPDKSDARCGIQVINKGDFTTKYGSYLAQKGEFDQQVPQRLGHVWFIEHIEPSIVGTIY